MLEYSFLDKLFL